MDGLRVGVTGSRKGAELCEALRRRGAVPTWGPMLAADKQVAEQPLIDRTRAILDAQPDWVAASTGTGVRRWLRAAERHGLHDELVGMLDRARVVARGAKAVGGLRGVGVTPEFTAPKQTDADLAGWLADRVAPGERVVVQLDARGATDAYDRLAERGATLTDVRPYRSSLPEDPGPAETLIRDVVEGRIDVIACTSPPAVRNLDVIAENLGRHVELATALATTCGVAAIGHRTAATLERHGLPVALMPVRPRTGAMLRSLESWAQRRARGEVVPAARRRWRIRLSPGTGSVRVGDREVSLGPLAFEVLATLVRRPGADCTHEQLATQAWGHDAPDHPGPVRDHVATIRERLGPAHEVITTVHGTGYRYDPRPVPAGDPGGA